MPVNGVNSSNATENRQQDNSQGRDLSYEVVHGDSLSDIARRHGVSLDVVISANPQITNPDLIYPGDSVLVPASATATVQTGDTLTAIAREYGITVQSIVSANDITNPDLIYPGDILRIPALGSQNTAGALPGINGDPVSVSDDALPTVTQVPLSSDSPFDYNQIQGLANNPNVTPAFIEEVEAIAARLGAQPEHLLAVMSFETGGSFSPSETNFIGATGLIQFIPSTARGLGTSTAQLARMSAVEQLEFVEKYFAQPQYTGKLGTLEGVYSAVLSGTATPDPDDTLPGFVQGSSAYRSNSPLDYNRDGRVTSGEATSQVAARMFGGVNAVQSQLVERGAVPTGLQPGFVDGRLGAQTTAAIVRFQQANGLQPTGYLDDVTGRALFGNAAQVSPVGQNTAVAGGDLQLSQFIHEGHTPGRQTITSPVIGELTITEGFMARGGPHSSKNPSLAIFSSDPTVAQDVAGGVYNLGIDYVTANGRIDSWFSGTVVDITSSSSGYGNRLIAVSDQTFTYQGQEYPVYAHYAHADSFTVGVGDRILAGQDIGDQGSTGHSTGDHVDFLTWIQLDNGSRVFVSPNLLAGGAP
ncbi:MAG: LysM peptidoglycan-binding domain-containing protein [Granulosicoccus sp.]